ncbi:hypothetical protein MJO29_000663 [Puccinia striiformis f. sp. tritici]|uniref:Uncharacterized protein n=2 Tax=Puccinia striiformis TaxID=27350 RepID=A0A2S4UNY8_9BASI|nr:hypothetical protein Pst134EA_000674 [Puccinia striiformis f. sp. tritici]KAI9601115.1 hypothetical protein H4Q26_000916 [Puccinia striiformis f. sp. tritici PST-130]POV98319.1 hypothetical protein PSTT_14504 [Puccinia striiformis]KAH9466822.1 hypothetical protein Pst134EB_001871 [Puccinia striiformis f. sp. tritici]KAH9473594.1 hypothetical protein Pst134EA_000674 [Puccinia striiformis f. sp. tritici]KAI7967386.1 hypothetical protein MJO29_000663 [Puccinia striiformis f. sp. tritici]
MATTTQEGGEPAATKKYYEELPTTKDEDNIPASKKQAISPKLSMACGAAPLAAVLAQPKINPMTLAVEKDKSCLVADILREQQSAQLNKWANP